MACQGMISAAQIRAARGLLDWSRKRLSEESGVPFSTLSDYETTRTSSMLSENLRKIVDAFDRAGVISHWRSRRELQRGRLVWGIGRR